MSHQQQEPSTNQSQSTLPFNEDGNYVVRSLGRQDGPIKKNGQKTFCVVLGLFDSNGAQVVHTRADGQEVPIVWFSYPIDTDDKPLLLL